MPRWPDRQEDDALPTLTLRARPTLPLDLGCLLPERLAGVSERAIAALPLRLGNRSLPLGELLAVRPGDRGPWSSRAPAPVATGSAPG